MDELVISCPTCQARLVVRDRAAVGRILSCPKCNGIGYRGRAALMEILVVDDDIRDLVMKETSAAELGEVACRNGMLTLRDVGLKRVKDGTSSLEEVLRVTSRD